MSAEGRWLSTATTKNTPSGTLDWHHTPQRASVAMVGARCVARIRYVPVTQDWMAKLDGWVWTVTPDMGSARFGLKETPLKAFKSVKLALEAVERAWAVPRHEP